MRNHMTGSLCKNKVLIMRGSAFLQKICRPYSDIKKSYLCQSDGNPHQSPFVLIGISTGCLPGDCASLIAFLFLYKKLASVDSGNGKGFRHIGTSHAYEICSDILRE